TIHVLDASRAVGVAGALMSPVQRDDFRRNVRKEYDEIRVSRSERREQQPKQSLAQARANRPRIDWSATPPPIPCFLGRRVLTDYPLEELVKYIDWTPFFRTW